MESYTKAVISNKFVEVTHRSYLPPTGRTSLGGRKPSSDQDMEVYQANIKKSINRARKEIRRLLECNFTNQYAFVTLTFRPSEEVDHSNIKTCNKLFHNFKKRLAYYLKLHDHPDFKYIGVTEFQDKNQLGIIHYHLVCNLTEIASNTIQELWKNGWVDKQTTSANAIDNKKIAFYLNKGITDPRLNGHKRFLHSQGLKKPLTLEITNQDEFYYHLNECKPTLEYDNTYGTRYTGESKYEQYYLEDAKELLKYAQELC